MGPDSDPKHVLCWPHSRRSLEINCTWDGRACKQYRLLLLGSLVNWINIEEELSSRNEHFSTFRTVAIGNNRLAYMHTMSIAGSGKLSLQFIRANI